MTPATPALLQARRIQPYTMPLMSLAATAIDQPVHRGEVITAMLQYLHTDSVLCRDEAGSSLADLQAEVGAGAERSAGDWPVGRCSLMAALGVW